jgi:hypothetical protein
MNTNRTTRLIRQSKRLLAVLLAFLAMFTVTQSQSISNSYTSAPFAEGEVLRYSVSWSFVHLGSIEIRQSTKRVANDARRRVQLTARTASGVPVVDIAIKDMALLLPSDPRCTDFIVRKDHDPKERKHYRYDPPTKRFTLEHVIGDQAPAKTARTEPRRCFDALGFLMYMRGLAGSGERIVVPTLMDFEIVDTRITCHRKVEEMDVEAFDDDVPAYRVSVSAGWEDESLGGMQGDYEVWFLDDPASIPVYAEIDLALGSISIELESCKRPGWKPGATAAKMQRGSKGKGGVR